jgi:hypothetical protein
MRHFFLFAAGLAVLGCADHDADTEREGGPIPEYDSGAMPDDAGGVELGAVTWCQASAVLESVCQRCHTDPPVNNAPFPLVTYENTQAQYYTSELKIYEVMERVVSSNLMPLRPAALMPPVESLTCKEKSTLLGWLAQGAKLEGPSTCSDADKVLTEVDEALPECSDEAEDAGADEG